MFLIMRTLMRVSRLLERSSCDKIGDGDQHYGEIHKDWMNLNFSTDQAKMTVNEH